MKAAMISTVLALGLIGASTASAQAFKYHAPRVSSYAAPRTTPVHVSGHVTRAGTYVAPSYRTAPNRTKVDNWSSKPNVNPYTGKAGTKNPYATPAWGH